MSSAPAIARSACSLALLFLVSTWSGEARAQLAVGNWARTDSTGMGMTLTVTACCNGGLRLAYHIPGVGDQARGCASHEWGREDERPALWHFDQHDVGRRQVGQDGVDRAPTGRKDAEGHRDL